MWRSINNCSKPKQHGIFYSKNVEAILVMDNSLEYAKMIEVPVKTCEYSFKKKPFFFRKKKVIKEVNRQIDEENNLLQSEFDGSESEKNIKENDFNAVNESEIASGNNLPTIYDEKQARREKRKSAFISAQVVAVFALISAIILTNVFWENSGMNTLFKSVFSSNTQNTTDTRNYSDFTLNIPVGDASGVEIINGAIGIEGEYSLYPVCEGTVSKVEQASDGTFTVTVKHSDNFLSVTEGLDLVYFTEGEEVFAHMPVGYVKKSAKVYLYNGESMLTDFATVENSIVFNK